MHSLFLMKFVIQLSMHGMNNMKVFVSVLSTIRVLTRYIASVKTQVQVCAA